MGYLLLFPRMTVKISFGILTFQIYLKIPEGWDYGSWLIDTPASFSTGPGVMCLLTCLNVMCKYRLFMVGDS